MKKYCWLMFFNLTIVYAHACDVCGCAASAFQIGILPGSKQHFIGLRSSVSLYRSTNPHEQDLSSSERFYQQELFFRWKFSSKMQFIGSMPYHYNMQKAETVKTSKGIGDFTSLLTYTLVNHADSLNRKIKHMATIGLGIKVPTGKSFQSGLIERNLLPGTGSFDALLNVNYSVFKHLHGLQTEISVVYKGKNKEGFQFGPAYMQTTSYVYRLKINGNVTCIPQIGLALNASSFDRINGLRTSDSFNGGYVLSSYFSLFYAYKNLGIQVQTFLPLLHELNQGFVHPQGVWKLNLQYYFKTNKNEKI